MATQRPRSWNYHLSGELTNIPRIFVKHKTPPLVTVPISHLRVPRVVLRCCFSELRTAHVDVCLNTLLTVCLFYPSCAVARSHGKSHLSSSFFSYFYSKLMAFVIPCKLSPCHHTTTKQSRAEPPCAVQASDTYTWLLWKLTECLLSNYSTKQLNVHVSPGLTPPRGPGCVRKG